MTARELNVTDADALPTTRKRIGAAHLGWALFALTAALAGYGAYRLEGQRRATAVALRQTRAEVVALRASVERSDRNAGEAARRAQLIAADRDILAADRERLRTDVDGLSTRIQQAEEQQARLATRLRESIASDVGELETTGEGHGQRVTLKLVDQVLFKVGEAELTPRGLTVLDRVAEALRAFPDQQVWVQGYTDATPIRDTTRFASNWELSTARAASVVHYLEDHAEIDARRLAIVGFGEHRPVSRRQSARNRRIEIVLFPEDVRVVRD